MGIGNGLTPDDYGKTQGTNWQKARDRDAEGQAVGGGPLANYLQPQKPEKTLMEMLCEAECLIQKIKQKIGR